jgi:zinc finger HIT domain-containing protein 1
MLFRSDLPFISIFLLWSRVVPSIWLGKPNYPWGINCNSNALRRHLYHSLWSNTFTVPRMELFGVQELPNSKSLNAPGWAYVAETGVKLSAGHQPNSRVRAARIQQNGSAHENTAKQDAKILRDLAALDKESHRDVQIPIPVRHRDHTGRGKFSIIPPLLTARHLAS